MFNSKKNVKKDWLTRYEAKYIIRESLVPEIRNFIAPFCQADPNAKNDPPEYIITTLQLDNPEYSLHYAKEYEAVKRFKLRVRTYGEIGTTPVYAEVKSKLNHTIIKNRALIPFEQWNRDILFGLQLPLAVKKESHILDFLQFKRLVWEIDARPVVVIRYVRESYMGVIDSYARITFDRKLQYQMTDSWTDFGRSGIWRNMDSTEAQGFGLPYSGVVMEVKTLAHTPTWVQDLVQKFQLRKSGNCKYSTAIWREGAFCGYPSANELTQENLSLF